jgi:hypothetical protein
MGTMKFDETWLVGGHGTFGAHEVEGLIWTWTPLSKIPYQYKTILNLQNQSHNIKRNERKTIINFSKSPLLKHYAKAKPYFVIGVMIITLLDSTRPKHCNTKILQVSFFLFNFARFGTRNATQKFVNFVAKS